MSFLKRLYQNLTKTLPKPNLKPTEALQKPNLKPTETLPKTNPEITLKSSFSISEFPLRAFLVIGKQGTGKTTLVKQILRYYYGNGLKTVFVCERKEQLAQEFPNAIFEPDITRALQYQKAIIAVDDLSRDLTKSIMNYITEKFREIRHNQQIIVMSHHLIKDVPSDLFALCDKVIFFNTSFNPNQPFSKVNHIISKSKKEQLHEKLLSLMPYHYIIVKHNRIYGEFSNLDIDPIIGDTNGQEITLINGKTKIAKKADKTKTLTINGEFKALLYQKVPEWDFLTVREKIIVLKQTFPRLKPRIISQIVGTTPQNVWKELSIARREGIIPKTP